jgi:polysaccharide pyruvyl transferase WcaK-like protein
MREKYRLGALGTYGSGNLGDEAIFVSFIEWANRHALQIEPVALCVNPQHIQQTYGVKAFAVAAAYARVPAARTATQALPAQGDAADRRPNQEASKPGAPIAPTRMLSGRIRRSLRRVVHPARALLGEVLAAAEAIAYFPTQLRVTRGLDGVLLLGGGQIHDFWSGPFGHPATLFFWALACRLRRKPFIVLSVGGVPLHSRLSRWFTRRALEWSRYASFRDEDTAEIAKSLGFRRPCPIAPDLAWGLQHGSKEGHARRDASRPMDERPTVIAVSPMVYQHPALWPQGDAQCYADYVDKLAAFCAQLAGQGHKVVLFASQIRSDPVAIGDVLARIPPVLRDKLRVQQVANSAELLRCLAHADIVVATRFHGVVLSLLAGRPALSVSYQQKNDSVLADLGEARYALDVHRFSLADLDQRFDELWERRHAYQARLAGYVRQQRARLDAQYDEVFAREGWVALRDRAPAEDSRRVAGAVAAELDVVDEVRVRVRPAYGRARSRYIRGSRAL